MITTYIRTEICKMLLSLCYMTYFIVLYVGKQSKAHFFLQVAFLLALKVILFHNWRLFIIILAFFLSSTDRMHIPT